jgi:uncharacterized protein
MSAGNLIEFGVEKVVLGPAGINPEWILEGNPIARNHLLSRSADGNSSSWIWDCTAGKFNWYYDIDETVYFIEGSVIIKDHASGTRQHLGVGDTVFFPTGSSAEWEVQSYIRKVAFLRAPLPRPVQFARRMSQSVKRFIRGKSGSANSPAPTMFQKR